MKSLHEPHIQYLKLLVICYSGYTLLHNRNSIMYTNNKTVPSYLECVTHVDTLMENSTGQVHRTLRKIAN